jgi:alpha-amylase
MCTKFFSDGAVHSYFNPYDTPYDAFINYMNVLNDFTLRVNAAVPQTGVEQEISNLAGIIAEKEGIISRYEEEIYELNKQLLLSGQEQDPAKKAPTAAAAKKVPVAAKKTGGGKSAARGTSAKKSDPKAAKSKGSKKPGSRKA